VTTRHLERGASTQQMKLVYIASAVSRFLDAAPPVSALGDALWPTQETAADGGHTGQPARLV
jgi:hypothetical protein